MPSAFVAVLLELPARIGVLFLLLFFLLDLFGGPLLVPLSLRLLCVGLGLLILFLYLLKRIGGGLFLVVLPLGRPKLNHQANPD